MSKESDDPIQCPLRDRRSHDGVVFSTPSKIDGGMWELIEQPAALVNAPRAGDRELSRIDTATSAAFRNHNSSSAVLLKNQIGFGSHGKVYKAWYGPQRQVVAVKIVRHSSDKTEIVTREVRLMMTLTHVNIVRAFYFLTWMKIKTMRESEDFAAANLNAQTWIVQEYCDGGCLSEYIQRSYFLDEHTSALDLRAFSRILIPLCEAIEYMHKENVIHADLKSSNVLLCHDDDGTLIPKVADFGVSKLIEDVAYVHTQTMGTISHMPPEMMLDGKMSKPADIFAMGMMMFEMATKTLPFQGQSQGAIIEQILMNKRPTIPDHVPERVSLIIRCCWKGVAAKRPTATELCALLRDL